MKKKCILKKVTAMALGLCLSSSMIAYASPSMSVDYSTAITNTGESRTFMDSSMGITYQATINEVSDINTTFKIDKEKSPQIGILFEIQYGYLDGDKFICTYNDSSVYKLNSLDKSYPIFHVVQVQHDLQAGISDRVYVALVDALFHGGEDSYFAYAFRLTDNANTTPAQPAEGWVQDEIGRWYQNADGTYPVNTWKEINREQYYFDGNGYMLSNTTTPDGGLVGANGVRIPTPEEEQAEDAALDAMLEERAKNVDVLDHSNDGPGHAGYDGSGEINLGGGL